MKSIQSDARQCAANFQRAYPGATPSIADALDEIHMHGLDHEPGQFCDAFITAHAIMEAATS